MGRVCLYGRPGAVGQRREAGERERGQAAEGPEECWKEVADAQTVLNRVPIWQSRGWHSDRTWDGGMKIATETDPRCAYMAKPGQRGSRRNVCTGRVCLYDQAGASANQWQGLGVPIWQRQS